MCELHSTERRKPPSLIHADAAAIAELNSLRAFALRCERGREVAAEIDERIIAKARRMGLAPDVYGDAIEDAAMERKVFDAGGDLLPMDEVSELIGVVGVVVGKRESLYMVSYDTPTGPQTMLRKRDFLTLIRRPARAQGGAA